MAKPLSVSRAILPFRSRTSSRYLITTLIILAATFLSLFNHGQERSHPFTRTIPPQFEVPPLEKVLVVASLKEENTRWIQQRLPKWPVANYIVDDPSAEFHVPLNKGREAMVYLTYLIDNYYSLPDVSVFIHGLQYQWHSDDPNHDSATVLSHLQLPYVASQGYVNLRCAWVLGCPEELHPNDRDSTLSSSSSSSKSPSIGDQTEQIYRKAYIDLFYGYRTGRNDDTADFEVPDTVGVSCCAQFAVSRDAVLRRPKSHYEWFRRWLLDTEADDEISGRVFEYSWHIIFGKPPVFCPDAETCYCNVFGFCDLEDCTDDECPGRYVLPDWTDVPDEWRQLPEYD